ncbi:MAG: DUF4266 domain-containing protein [Verrucomicrobia bacterium]|nr:DUF4266 domain-containing protein [Verrucomicrobiota bacterium]
MRSALRLLVLAFAAMVTAFSTGCTSTNLVRVKPWERAALADYTMNPGRDPLATAMAEHVFFSRETATGGRGVGGSGCGCN